MEFWVCGDDGLSRPMIEEMEQHKLLKMYYVVFYNNGPQPFCNSRLVSTVTVYL